MIALSSGAFTDNKTADLHLIAEGDRVVAHYRWTGVNTGSMGEGMPATNKAIGGCAALRERESGGALGLHGGVQDDGTAGHDARR